MKIGNVKAIGALHGRASIGFSAGARAPTPEKALAALSHEDIVLVALRGAQKLAALAPYEVWQLPSAPSVAGCFNCGQDSYSTW